MTCGIDPQKWSQWSILEWEFEGSLSEKQRYPLKKEGE
jgi:hypothetical protein